MDDDVKRLREFFAKQREKERLDDIKKAQLAPYFGDENVAKIIKPYEDFVGLKVKELLEKILEPGSGSD